MRKGGLELLVGEGKAKEARCELCDLHVFIHGEDEAADAEARVLITKYLGTKKEGRIVLCTAHREDVDALGAKTRRAVEAVANRHQRRANKAVIQRAHRKSIEAARRIIAPKSEPPKPKGPGGVEF